MKQKESEVKPAVNSAACQAYFTPLAADYQELDAQLNSNQAYITVSSKALAKFKERAPIAVASVQDLTASQLKPHAGSLSPLTKRRRLFKTITISDQ